MGPADLAHVLHAFVGMGYATPPVADVDRCALALTLNVTSLDVDAVNKALWAYAQWKSVSLPVDVFVQQALEEYICRGDAGRGDAGRGDAGRGDRVKENVQSGAWGQRQLANTSSRVSSGTAGNSRSTAVGHRLTKHSIHSKDSKHHVAEFVQALAMLMRVAKEANSVAKDANSLKGWMQLPWWDIATLIHVHMHEFSPSELGWVLQLMAELVCVTRAEAIGGAESMGHAVNANNPQQQDSQHHALNQLLPNKQPPPPPNPVLDRWLLGFGYGEWGTLIFLKPLDRVDIRTLVSILESLACIHGGYNGSYNGSCMIHNQHGGVHWYAQETDKNDQPQSTPISTTSHTPLPVWINLDLLAHALHKQASHMAPNMLARVLHALAHVPQILSCEKNDPVRVHMETLAAPVLQHPKRVELCTPSTWIQLLAGWVALGHVPSSKVMPWRVVGPRLVALIQEGMCTAEQVEHLTRVLVELGKLGKVLKPVTVFHVDLPAAYVYFGFIWKGVFVCVLLHIFHPHTGRWRHKYNTQSHSSRMSTCLHVL